MRAPLDVRLWTRVTVSTHRTPGVPGGPCWLFTGGTSADGYGKLWHDGRWVYTHRLAYELLAGPIPDGLTLDHLCRVRACCNPRHLEPVTRGVNVLRGDTIMAAHAAGRDCGAATCGNHRAARALLERTAS